MISPPLEEILLMGTSPANNVRYDLSWPRAAHKLLANSVDPSSWVHHQQYPSKKKSLIGSWESSTKRTGNPTSYKWSDKGSPYKWPHKWMSFPGVISLLLIPLPGFLRPNLNDRSNQCIGNPAFSFAITWQWVYRFCALTSTEHPWCQTLQNMYWDVHST